MFKIYHIDCYYTSVVVPLCFLDILFIECFDVLFEEYQS